MHDAGNPEPALCDRLERWGGEGGRRGLRRKGTHACPWPTHVDVRPMYGKTRQNIAK